MIGGERRGALRRIVIVGGGTAGWMTAASLIEHLRGPGRPIKIELVESPDIGTIGVGEATLPTIRFFNRRLGLDPVDFVAKTKATFKLGIDFCDWGHIGNRFFHGFGDYGPRIGHLSPHHHWLRLRQAGIELPLQEWSIPTMAAMQSRFAPPAGDQTAPDNAFSYAFHFDAGLYAAFLRDYAMARGVVLTQRKVIAIDQDPDDGFIAALRLEDGTAVRGDLFIDCSGFRSLLLAGVLGTEFIDWSAWLPANSALAVPSERVEPLAPYTRSTARRVGWQWRIPLQHRIGNGIVYANGFLSDDEAAATLLAGLDGAALDSPRQLRFTTGRRAAFWVKNCVAIGLSTGFVEPLESTSINLIESGINALLDLLPGRDCEPQLAEDYNRRMSLWYEHLRDFIILHYKVTRRDDSEFWRTCAAMPIPERLDYQIRMFRNTATIVTFDRDSFTEPSWLAMYLGLGVMPQAYNGAADAMDQSRLLQHIERHRASVAKLVQVMPSHATFIQESILRYADNAVPG